MKKLPSFFLIVFIIFTSITVSYAAVTTSTSVQTDSAKLLSKLGILDNSKTSSKVLKSKIKKYEFITILVKTLGYDENEDVSEVTLPYKDIDKSHKAYNNIKIAYKYGLITGEKRSSLSPNGYITYVEALKMVLSGLGYSDITKDLSVDDVVKTASEAGICANINLSANKHLTYGDVCLMVYNSLTADFK
jgi:hypothetical protein